MSVSQYASLGGVWSGKGQYRKQKVNEILPLIFQTEKKKKQKERNNCPQRVWRTQAKKKKKEKSLTKLHINEKCNQIST